MTRAAFFDAVRKGILGPTLSQGEVDGCSTILDETADWPGDWQAYALGTVFHETAGTMQPILERGGEQYFNHRYGPEGANPELAKRLGNTQPGDGARYAGRGLVQITGRANYAAMGKRLGLPLEDHPEQALIPATAARILRVGMSEGLFTEKRLGDYFSSAARDPVGARHIINGSDDADLIANYFYKFRAALA